MAGEDNTFQRIYSTYLFVDPLSALPAVIVKLFKLHVQLLIDRNGIRCET